MLRTWTGLVAFEWRRQTRHLAFAAALAGFAGMGLLLVATGYGPDNVNIDSPYVVTQAMGLLTLPAIFVLTVFCTGAALRDTESGMTEIVYATSIGKAQYLLGRFAGAFLASSAVLAAGTAAMLLAPHVVSVPPERLGVPHLAHYAWALCVVGLPNLLFVGSLVFAVSALTRSTAASYVSGVAVYALYFICSLLIGSPLMAGAAPQSADAQARAAVLDPFGLSAFFEQTRYWTPAERNARLVSLSGHFLLNRLLWIAVAAAVLALTYRLFAFRVGAGSRTGRAVPADPTADGPIPPYRPTPPPPRRGPLEWAALGSAVRLELGALLRSRPFGGLMVMWIVDVAFEIASGVNALEYGTRLYPTTGLMFDGIRAPLALLGSVCVLYYAAEVVWRERSARVDAVLDATPASSTVFYLSKAAALCAVPVLMTLVGIAVGVTYQLAHGFRGIEPGLYLSLLYYAALPLMLLAVAMLLVQTLSPNRYAGIVLSLGVVVVARQGPMLGLEHPMLRFADLPPLEHTDLTGFGQAGVSFHWLMAYWAAFAGVLALATLGAWRRRTAATLARRLARMPRGLGRRGMLGALGCLLLFVGTGAFIFHDANVVNGYQTEAQENGWRADYERAFRPLGARPQPSVTAVRTDVALYPAQGRYTVEGAYRLENRAGRAIDTVWVAMPRGLRAERVAMDDARPVAHAGRFQMYAFVPRVAMAPGASATLRFRLEARNGGVQAGEVDRSIVENGSFVVNLSAFPTLGYRASYEVRNPAVRRALGLPARTTLGEDDADGAAAAWTTLDATVSTSADQVALGSGRLVRRWETGGRRYFRYVTEGAIDNRFGFTSGRYAVRSVRHGGVDVQVYYHPAHAWNVDRMLDAATRSLDYFGARFGPYPHRELRIVEVPSYWGFGALALPGTIYFVEDRGFTTDARDTADLDLVTRRVAHEVSHQWWGHQVDPASGPGRSMLVETLAKYSEQMVLRETHGPAALPRLLQFDLDRYLRGRAGGEADEPPLDRATDQSYIYYGKGAVVMSALRDLMGEAALDRALHRLVAEHGYPHPAPATADFLAILHDEAQPQDRALIDEWITGIVLYDLKAGSATCRRLPDGTYRVTARIAARRTVRRGGRDVPAPLDEVLGIAAYGATASGAPDPARVLYSGRARVRGPATTVSFVVPTRPAAVEVDPNVLRIELERADNLAKTVEIR